jgi:hypothetical protein
MASAARTKVNGTMEVLLNEGDKKLYSKLYVSSEDIGFAKFCASVILRKGWHHDSPGRRMRWRTYQQQAAFTTALVTAYGRPFTQSKGWPKFPEDLLKAYSSADKALHAQLIKLRHTVYAHSDSASHSIQPWRSEDFSTDIITWVPLRLTLEDTTLFQEMTGRLRVSIDDKMKDILSKYQ